MTTIYMLTGFNDAKQRAFINKLNNAEVISMDSVMLGSLSVDRTLHDAECALEWEMFKKIKHLSERGTTICILANGLSSKERVKLVELIKSIDFAIDIQAVYFEGSFKRYTFKKMYKEGYTLKAIRETIKGSSSLLTVPTMDEGYSLVERI